MSNQSPFAVAAGEGKVLNTPTGDVVTVKADTSRTNASMTILEFLIAPGSGPPLHTHLREDELWYVVEGEFRFKAGGVMLYAAAGGMAFGPRNLPHAFQNIGDGPGRLLVVTTPSGLERFFEQFADVAPEELDTSTLGIVGSANWLDFVGPPVSLSDPL